MERKSQKKNLATLAKGNTKKPTVKNKKTVDEEAKERINNLTASVKETEKLEETKKEDVKSNIEDIKWLKEQLGVLLKENERLKRESSENEKKYEDVDARKGALILFNEIQNNYLGNNNENKRYSDIKLYHLLEMMVKTFRFLKEKKRY